MAKEKTNAQRFIEAFNEIDYSLRVQHSVRRSLGFSDMIRQVVVVNHVVRKYEENLIDYARLRNAIVHSGKGNIVMAEPHISVVENVERIAKLVTTPPRVLDKMKQEAVMTVLCDVNVKEVVMLIAKMGFSNIPVFKDNTLIGLANGQKILDYIGKRMINDRKFNVDLFMKTTQIKEVIETDCANFYEMASASLTVEEALDKFYRNSKLLVLLITKTGGRTEMPIGIVTKTDVMQLNAALENY